MVFTVSDYNDLIRLLREHPDWQVQLRQLLLSDDFLALPEIVRSLAAAQQRTEQRLEELAAAQQRTEQRLESLSAQVETLAVAQQRTEQRLETLITSHERLVDKVGNLKGQMLELTYSQKAGAYLGRLLRKVRVVPVHTLEDTLEVHLSSSEFDDVLLLDLLVRGTPRHHPELPEVWLALEISSVIDRHDVSRVLRRTQLLRQAGYQAVPVVAGEEITQGAQEEATRDSVVVLQDGRILLWTEALQAWVSG